MIRAPRRSTLFPYTTLFRSAASLVLFGLTLELKANPLVPIGPGFYPRIVLGVTALLAVLLVVTDWSAAKKAGPRVPADYAARSEEHTSELQSQSNLGCRLLL